MEDKKEIFKLDNANLAFIVSHSPIFSKQLESAIMNNKTQVNKEEIPSPYIYKEIEEKGEGELEVSQVKLPNKESNNKWNLIFSKKADLPESYKKSGLIEQTNHSFFFLIL